MCSFSKNLNCCYCRTGTRHIEKCAARTSPTDCGFSLWSLRKSRMMSRNTQRPLTFISFWKRHSFSSRALYRSALREPCLNMRSEDFWRSRTYWTRDLTCVDSSAPRELEGTEKLHYVGRHNRYRVFMWLLCRRCRNFGIPMWLRMIRWWTMNWEGFGKSQSWLSRSICLGGLRRTKQQFRIMWLTPKRR